MNFCQISMTVVRKSVCVKHLKVWFYVDVVNAVICQSNFTKLCLKLYLCVYTCVCVVCVGERLLLANSLQCGISRHL